MVRLHVLNNKIIRSSAVQSLFKIVKPNVRYPRVSSVHYRYLLVNDNIRVVRNAVWHNILALKKVNVMIVCTNINN